MITTSTASNISNGTNTHLELVLVQVAVAATVDHERPLVMNCCVVASANAGSHDQVTLLVPVAV